MADATQAPVAEEATFRETAAAPARGYLRDRSDEDSARVSFAELFYDLVFVFAVTQLSAYLLENLTPEGLVRGAVLFFAIWWLWITTAWATNRLDPDRNLVRVVIFALMGGGLMFSAAIPQAFDDRGLVFALAYVTMQLLRSLFLVWALLRHEEHAQARTFERVSVWFAVSGCLWIGGAIAESDLRIVLWALALVVDVTVPWMGYWVPGMGRSSAREWDIEGEHLAERCGLFMIIALGESLLVTGARLAQAEWDAAILLAFGVALLAALAMWWLYFDLGHRRGTLAFERSKEPGRLARFAYTYVQMPIVAGIVLTAVGDKVLLADPEGPSGWTEALVLLGGPALFLFGNYLFKNATHRRWPVSHLVGMGLMALPLLSLGTFSTFSLSAYSTAVLIAVALLEGFLLRSREAARAGLN